MRLKTLFNKIKLLEMPVQKFERKGDFSKDGHIPNTSSFNKRTDIKLLRHEKTESLIRKALQRFPQKINVYVLNNRQLTTQTFLIPSTRLYYSLIAPNTPANKEVLKVAGIGAKSNQINIIILSNTLASKYEDTLGPMSGWMCIHRLWQTVYDFKLVPDFNTDLADLVANVHKLCPKPAKMAYIVAPFTFRSAREKNIQQTDDLIFELLTQYCFKGTVEIRPPEEVWEMLYGSGLVRGFTTSDTWRKDYLRNSEKLKAGIQDLADRTMAAMNGHTVLVV